LLALANWRRLCEKFRIKFAVNQISRLKKTSGHTLMQRAGHWGRLMLLVLVFFPGAVSVATAQTDTNWIFEATNNLGQWIWDTNTFDKQTCQLWKSFDIPREAKVARAILRITVDNGYSLFLDGREIGRGSDWRTVTEYDVTQLLNPGPHSLGVEAFNDRLEAGLIFGLHVELVMIPGLSCRKQNEIGRDAKPSCPPGTRPS
jgi:hypothetical protein